MRQDSVPHKQNYSPALLLLIASIWIHDAYAQDDFFRPEVTTLNLSDDMITWGSLGGVTVDRLGYVYVTNFGADVWRVSKSGTVKLLTDSMYEAAGNAIDLNGDLLQATHSNGNLYRISRNGEISLLVDGELNGPVGVAINRAGEIFVTNCWTNNIARIKVGGKLDIFSENGSYLCPNGLAFDLQGNLFVVSFDNTIITRITPEGEESTLATLPGVGNSHIAYFKNHLYVTQIFEHRIFQISSDGSFKVLAGDGTSGTNDGPGTQAQIAWPNGIAISRTGRLYVNTLTGEFRNRNKASQLQLKTIDLPTLSRTLERAYNSGGKTALKPAYDWYRSKYAADAKESSIIAGFSNEIIKFIGRGKIDEVIAVAELNTQLHPQAWEAWVGLGDAYAAANNRALARKYFEKALLITPESVTIESRIDELLIP